MMEIHIENSNELLHNRFPEKNGNGPFKNDSQFQEFNHLENQIPELFEHLIL